MASPITIVQGEDRELSFGLTDLEKKVYIDLTGATEISLKVESSVAGQSVECLLSEQEIVVTSALSGKFKALFTDEQTALMKLGKRLIEVTIDWADKRRIVQMSDALNIVNKKLV